LWRLGSFLCASLQCSHYLSSCPVEAAAAAADFAGLTSSCTSFNLLLLLLIPAASPA
jgi:hypothetical protein